MRGSRIIPPLDMRQELLDDVHLLHPGVVTMRRYLRQMAWWPGMDSDVVTTINSCYTCTLNSTTSTEPLALTLAPDQPWDLVAIDLHSHQPLKTGPYNDLLAKSRKKHLLVIIDRTRDSPVFSHSTDLTRTQ